MGKNYYMRLQRIRIGGKELTKFSMNSDVISSDFNEQFEGDAGEIVLTNDWLISI